MRSIRDCSVAVVGGAGFLGSHLVDHLIEDRGCDVLVIDNLISGRKEFVHPDATFEHHDITGSEVYLHKLFEVNKIRFVFNLAAEPYIPVSFARPLHVFDINAMGALKVINAAWESGCEGVLQVSSAEIYGGITKDHLPTDSLSEHSGGIDEDYPVTPHSSYGAAKAAIDAMVQVRWKEAQVPVLALRLFNCIGERETHPYIVPEIISQLAVNPIDKAKKGVVRLGNNSFRDFQYAGDAVRMTVELLEKGEFGSVYNMGSESGIQMYDLAKLIGEIMGIPVTVETEQSRVRPWEIWHLQSCNDKLYSVIDSRPEYNLRQSLEKTIEYFYRVNRKWSWE